MFASCSAIEKYQDPLSLRYPVSYIHSHFLPYQPEFTCILGETQSWIMADPSRPIRVRRRTVFSCEGCRRRKIKCDRTHPCRGCRQSDVICSYPEGAAPLHCHITPVASAEDTTELPAPTSIIPIASLPLSNLPISGIRDEYPQWPPHRSWKSPDNSNESSDDSPKVRALVEKVQRLEQLLSEYMPDEVVGESNRPVSVESRVQLRGTLSKTRYLGPTHWMNTANLVKLVRIYLPYRS
jgi:hypothetical protein